MTSHENDLYAAFVGGGQKKQRHNLKIAKENPSPFLMIEWCSNKNSVESVRKPWFETALIKSIFTLIPHSHHSTIHAIPYFLVGIICGPVWGSFAVPDHLRKRSSNWKRRLCVLEWTENIFKTELFENDGVTIIMWSLYLNLPQKQIQNDRKNAWSRGEAEEDIEVEGETKLTVSRGASH